MTVEPPDPGLAGYPNYPPRQAPTDPSVAGSATERPANGLLMLGRSVLGAASDDQTPERRQPVQH